MRTEVLSAVKLCGVAAVAMALLCVAAVEAKTQPNKLMPGAEPFALYPGIGRYSIHAELKNWTDAHKICSLENGHLAVIDSEEEAVILLEIMDTNSKTDIHIGLHDMFREGKFVSIRGQELEKLGFQKWASTYPVGGTTYNYGGLKNAGGLSNTGTGLTDKSYTSQFTFICELPMWDDYDLIPGYGYYKLHTGSRTWKESWETCRSEGSYLLLFASTLERNAVVDKYSGDLSSNVWYGAHHMFANQYFVTIFDEPLDQSGFNSWESGHPGSISNTQYPYLALKMVAGGTNNLFLYTSTLPFICKHNLHDRA